MNILFDFITTQTSFGGGGCEYVRRVFYALKEATTAEFRLIGIVDSSIGQYPYSDLSPETLRNAGIEVIDINGKSLSDIVREHNIDKIFVGLSQVWAKRYSFEGVNCEVITITHDIHDEELESIRLYSYQALYGNVTRKTRQFLARCIISIKKRFGFLPHPMKKMVDELKGNAKWHCITVSEFSKHSFIYQLGVPEERIEVLYSPERMMQCDDSKIDDDELRNIIREGKKFYLLVNAGRPEKNAAKTLEAFRFYRDNYLKDKDKNKDEDKNEDKDKNKDKNEDKNKDKELPLIITVGMREGSKFEGHIDLKPLSESDLVNAYKHCYALIYPSFFEGFGYPPVEAMKFGKPILASNVTSIPEVLGDAPIYFSPFFVSDIFKALCSLNDGNYDEYKQKAEKRYKEVSKRQQADLQRLISIITE